VDEVGVGGEVDRVDGMDDVTENATIYLFVFSYSAMK
jgi:hypothetical protein